MGVRKGRNGEKARDRDPFLAQLGPFHCAGCLAPLDLVRVVSASVDRQDGVPTGYVTFEHHCMCSPSELRVSRLLGTQFGFVSLFGTPPVLPYRAPFEWQDVAPEDPTVARWRWELEQVADWHDFMLFLSDSQ
jgi:hypothetical protein